MEEARERFFRKVNKTDTCWLWIAACQYTGHGRFNYNGKSVSAHRFSWLLAGHTIPEGLCVCHAPHSICGHKNCVNPAHLRVDTIAANNHDKIADGTSTRGTRNSKCKLTEEQVREIRRRGMESERELAEEFGVSQMTINLIINKKTWIWLE